MILLFSPVFENQFLHGVYMQWVFNVLLSVAVMSLTLFCVQRMIAPFMCDFNKATDECKEKPVSLVSDVLVRIGLYPAVLMVK